MNRRNFLKGGIASSVLLGLGVFAKTKSPVIVKDEEDNSFSTASHTHDDRYFIEGTLCRHQSGEFYTYLGNSEFRNVKNSTKIKEKDHSKFLILRNRYKNKSKLK